MKRFIQAVCLLVIMATVAAVPAYAAEAESTRGSSYFMSTSTYIDQDGKSLDLWFDVSAVRQMDELGADYI